MDEYKFSAIIPWHLLKKHLLEVLERRQNQMLDSDGEKLYRLQGRCQQLRELLNLPETLTILLEGGKEDDASKPQGQGES